MDLEPLLFYRRKYVTETAFENRGRIVILQQPILAKQGQQLVLNLF